METLGGGMSHRDGGDGSHRRSVRTCFMGLIGLTGTIMAFHLSSHWVQPFPLPLAQGDRRSEHLIARYGPLKSRV